MSKHAKTEVILATASRRAAFIAEHGDRCVELDALPVDVLRERIESEVQERMDLKALAVVKKQEKQERQRLVTLLSRKGDKS
jgi:hypothetical protein